METIIGIQATALMTRFVVLLDTIVEINIIAKNDKPQPEYKTFSASNMLTFATKSAESTHKIDIPTTCIINAKATTKNFFIIFIKYLLLIETRGGLYCPLY